VQGWKGTRYVPIRVAGAAFIACLASVALLAGRAEASQAITSFTAEPSGTQAGGHPDLSLSFRLDPDSDEAAESALLDAPPGVLLLPPSIVKCSSAGFAQKKCPLPARSAW